MRQQGFGHERLGEQWQALSPLHNIAPGAPPTTVFFGTEDPWAQSAGEYKKRMEEAGSRCDLHMYEGQPHGFFNYREDDNEYFYLTLIEADRFLASLGYIEERPVSADELRRTASPGSG